MLVVQIPVKNIWADPSFNCRGQIAPIDVVELAKDIDKHGLLQPIVVRPIDKNGFSHQVITGHRRHKAFELLNKKFISCIVNEDISDADALILNLGENLHRKDLNVLQEARALERLKLAGFSTNEVAKHIGKSQGWVNIRYQLLELPDIIKEAAAAGYITQKHIQELHRLGDYKKQVEMAVKIKKARVSGEKIPTIIRKKRNMFKRKPRETDDLFYMQAHIQDHIGNNFGTRCLAWAAGEISDLELYRDIQAIADKVDIEYKIPYDEGS